MHVGVSWVYLRGTTLSPSHAIRRPALAERHVVQSLQHSLVLSALQHYLPYIVSHLTL